MAETVGKDKHRMGWGEEQRKDLFDKEIFKQN